MSSKGDSRESKVTSFIVYSAIVASLASFNVGWNTGVTNIPEENIRSCHNSSGGLPPSLCVPKSMDLIWGFSVGLFAIGGLIGGLTGGMAADKLGRRKTLILNNLFYILGGVILTLSPNIAVFAIGRVIVGIGCGVSSVLVSTFIGEIASNRNRGALGSMLQLTLNMGILVTQCVGLPLDNIPGWRVLLALTIAPAALQMGLLFGCVETPRWLASKGRYNEARSALERLRAGYDIETEYDEIMRAQRPENTATGSVDKLDKLDKVEQGTQSFVPTSTYSAMDLFSGRAGPVLRRHLFVAILLHVGQQLTGINGVIFYSTATFTTMFGESAKYVTIGAVGSIGVIVTAISLMLVDKLGRKKLLFLSSVGMAVSSSLLVVGSLAKINILVLISVMLFISSFGVGLGPIPWLMVPELFPTNAVGAATSVATGANYLCNFTIGMIFPKLAAALGNFAFIPYAIIGAVVAFLILTMVPETKGRSLEEITSGR
ncbi:Bifunctional purine biosynthesis protein PurH [Dispira parvispora]|uniref:Bifunctional purine biosynthesis protein PurH n=1 Tax=Dispira parvispora TaxID=1520584 RepID=A0A9W8AR35_9FUNG|nr:Bifunctional purine biosynthesis protein PurH [Dispira parvispora]